MEFYERMREAARNAVTVVEGVKPERLGDPTPCDGWNVEALIEHLTTWAGYGSELAARKEPFDGTPHQAGFAEQMERTMAAWGEAGALDGTSYMAMTEMPAPVVGRLYLTELVLHGWDLARATGQEPVVSEELATVTLEAVTMTAERGRAYGIMGPEVAVPASASTLERALAMSGRDPYAW
ncbi:TIGR03086 family metal-binding protein [Streptosporangium lutulentum]|uniref:Uncharacterized protein (TIGR03086 family) n=1 Tax=Streptosporangium lutulentum TaxID=1461250 RepID=A0ABT9QLF6_9ACTN|nr:TIGR03086 family metal-binding protein [Streptosporangium lutulentum]MDP9847205.1 uncharacterized protein (TIGR03086 family) [Streptosporangium lutulentum]